MGAYAEEEGAYQAVRETAMDRIDQELDRLEKAIEDLTVRVGPVSTSMSDVDIRPSEEERSPLEARGIRLGVLNSRIDRVIRNLDI